MYCAKCGAKIRPGKSRCDSCGAAAPDPDYCGGFWGLLSKEDGPSDKGSLSSGERTAPEFSYDTWSAGASGKEAAVHDNHSRKYVKGGVQIDKGRDSFMSKAAIPAIAAAFLLLVVTVVVSVRGGGERTRLQEELEQQREQVAQLSGEKDSLQETIDGLKTDQENMGAQIKDLEQQVEELKDENNRLSRHIFDNTWREEEQPSEEDPGSNPVSEEGKNNEEQEENSSLVEKNAKPAGSYGRPSPENT